MGWLPWLLIAAVLNVQRLLRMTLQDPILVLHGDVEIILSGLQETGKMNGGGNGVERRKVPRETKGTGNRDIRRI